MDRQQSATGDQALVSGEIVDERLATLRATIEAEHQALIAAGQSMIEHAIRAGNALIEAKAHVGHGDWEAWLLREFPHRSLKTWRLYMRVARHADQVRAVGPANLQDAHRLLVGAPIIPHDDELRRRACELRGAGLSYAQIGDRLGVSVHAAQSWTDEGFVERERERHHQQSRAAQREAHKAARDRMMIDRGGPLLDAYRKVGIAIQSLADALDMGEGDSRKVHLATTKLRQAEDEIIAAARRTPADRLRLVA